MSALRISPFEQLFDENGTPLDAGYIYIGVSHLNPETNPIAVFYDADMTIPVSQPIRTTNGYVLNAGSPAILYVNSDYSVKVKDVNSVQIYYIPSFLDAQVGGSADTLFVRKADLEAMTGASLVGYTGDGVTPRTVQDVLNERVSPLDYGAIGDGVTDDTQYFKELEEDTTKTTIDLAGGTYSIVSSAVDPVDGATLTKDYVNGVLLVDGRPLIFDKNLSFSTSAASVNRLGQASTPKVVALKCNSANEYEVWRPLGGHYWAQMILRRTGSGIPLNWQETRIKQVFGYTTADEPGTAFTGTWATETGTTRLTDNSGNLYVNGRGAQATVAGDYVDIAYNGGGDLYVIYASRTSGNFVNVLLDGAQEYITLPDDGAGNRYFDSYATPDLGYKTIVKIAAGVPSGAHTIRLTVSASKNPSSTGGRFIFNALSYDSPEMSPARKEADAKVWASGVAVKKSQVRKYGANYYYAGTDFTTGATPPTHTSGTVSDGGGNWTFRAITSYGIVDSAIHVAGSQLEYAYQMKPTGATDDEDVGGALHGNEVQTSLKISVGNLPATLSTGQWLTGDLISFKEVIYSTHSEIGSGLTPIINTVLERIFKRQWIEIHHKHTLAMDVTLGYYYPHMWPLLHYHGAANKYAVRKVWSPSDGDRLCANFYGQVNPFIGRTKDTLMVAYGECLQPDGGGGIPTAIAAPLQFAAWISIDPSSVDSYAKADSLFAAKAMNTSGADVSAGGFSSMTSKIYFERYSSRTPRLITSGTSFDCFARYGLDLIIN